MPRRYRGRARLFAAFPSLEPAGDLGSLGRGPSTNLVRLLGWAQNPYIKRVNMTFCLLADQFAEVNDRYWAYWREVPDEAGQPRREFLFVEMDGENSWFQIRKGSQIDPKRVVVY